MKAKQNKQPKPPKLPKLEVKRLCKPLIGNPFDMYLCTDEEAYHAILTVYQIPLEDRRPFVGVARATATVYLNEAKGVYLALVCMPIEREPAAKVHTILGHEAMHIWQNIKEYFGELEPSREFEAYAHQALTEDLIAEYDRQLKVKRERAKALRKVR